MKKLLILITGVMLCACSEQTHTRHEQTLETGWRFVKDDPAQAHEPSFDDSNWQDVTIPHDWAIYGPFDRVHDLQKVAVTQNGETTATEKTGRTGGLPYTGVGWYRTRFDVEDFSSEKRIVTLYFDGAMSQARVYVNGKEVGYWPYGYNSFYFDVTEFVNANGKDNTLAVRLENKPESSRWYSGAGLYRDVRLIVTERAHIPIWGTYVTTSQVSKASARIVMRAEIKNHDNRNIRLHTIFKDQSGKLIATTDWQGKHKDSDTISHNFTIDNPQLWSPESPALYTAQSTLYIDDQKSDTYTTRFGIRSIEYTTQNGFMLNGTKRKFQGVCNHHDLGPLGAAVNRAALRRQITMLKDMGCDAIRTAHNMPATDLVELCDEMGMMVMVESFDEWDVAKCKNGYHRFFDEWAERDMVNLVRHFRNNPSVVMWSIGNEVPTQHSEDGRKIATWLQEICHREDPTRPVTCGMDQVKSVLANGFAEAIDIVGLNYRTRLYNEAHETLPNKLILGSETASTVSSRGVYKFPVVHSGTAIYEDHQSSSYDLEHCYWSNIPDEDFALADDNNWTIGQFVWTGFDYLGEPSPYDTDAWPSHSSLFGIIDLASIPKDRYYLYRSMWNKTSNTLHMLPHWTWPERVGEKTPVFVYTNYSEAELFVNGKSQGRRSKNDSTLLNRYRLMWNDVVYEPGELKVVAYNEQGDTAQEKIIRTAGAPHSIRVVADRSEISADGKDLAYLRVSIVDKDGNLCPKEGSLIKFSIEGSGTYRAAANGDPTCLDQFHKPQMHAFSGELTAIVQAGRTKGKIKFTATSESIASGTVTITTK